MQKNVFNILLTHGVAGSHRDLLASLAKSNLALDPASVELGPPPAKGIGRMEARLGRQDMADNEKFIVVRLVSEFDRTRCALTNRMLRQAQKADIAGMHRVRLAVRENTLSSPDRITEADYVAALERLGRTWVMEADGEIAAFATGCKSGNIWALFVHPDHEGLGYGKALHAAMVNWLWSQGLSRLWLTTAPGTRAEGFYRSLGWEPCGIVGGGEVRLELDRP